MAVEVSCACGQRFAAQPHLYGKIVPCPNCGHSLTIPQPAKTAQQIVVACRCGQRFAAEPHLAGKQLPCPSCGNTLLVASAGAAAPRSQPQPRTAAESVNDPMGNPALEDFGVAASDYGMPTKPYRPFAPATPKKQIALTTGAIVYIAIAVVSVVGFVLVSLLIFNWWSQTGRELDAELAQWRDSGEPMTPEELEAYYRLPPSAEDTTGETKGSNLFVSFGGCVRLVICQDHHERTKREGFITP